MIVNYAEFIISNTSDKIAIIEDDKTLTYQQLAIHVRRSAYQLKSLGIVPGDRIIISLPDSIEWVVAFLSCIKIGAVPMQASPLILHHKIVEIINFVKAHAIVSKEIFNGIIRIDPNELLSSGPELDDYYNFSPDEIALAVTTSGSTSDSKFACHRHQNLINYLNMASPYLKIDHDTRMFCTSKMSHVAGLNMSLTLPLGNKATVVLTKKNLTPTVIFNIIKQNNITHLFSSPGVVAMMLKIANISVENNLVFAGCGSQRLPAELFPKFKQIFGLPIQAYYGISECCSLVVCESNSDVPSLDRRSVGNINSLPEGVNLEIRNIQGQICATNEVGEIYINHSCLASFYWNNWQKSQEVFCGKWFKTKDLAYIDQQGYIIYVSRLDELVKINGLAVSIIQVEDTIMQYPGVEDCVVSLKQNRNELDKLHALVVYDGDMSGLRHFLQEHLESYKIPTFIEQVKEIPKTWSGKKFRRKL